MQRSTKDVVRNLNDNGTSPECRHGSVRDIPDPYIQLANSNAELILKASCWLCLQGFRCAYMVSLASSTMMHNGADSLSCHKRSHKEVIAHAGSRFFPSPCTAVYCNPAAPPGTFSALQQYSGLKQV